MAGSEELTERAQREKVAADGRWRLYSAAGAIVLGIAIAGAWIERRPIARHYVDTMLARDHVPARYSIARLGPGRQRLTGVVIGDPRHPDLVADWIETRTRIGMGGVHLSGVAAGHVRVRARWADGKLSLGALDWLLPAPSGRAAGLPQIALAIENLQVRLDTPKGRIALRLSGSGSLAGGFAGRLAGRSTPLRIGGCKASPLRGEAVIRIAEGRPLVEGRIRGEGARCDALTLDRFAMSVRARFSPGLDRWQGSAQLILDSIAAGQTRLAGLSGSIGFDGTATGTSGAVNLASGRFAGAGLDGGGLGLVGGYRLDHGRTGFDGTLAARQLALPSPSRATLRSWGAKVAGTPFDPLASKAATALAAAASGFSAKAPVRVVGARGGGQMDIGAVNVTTRSGARAVLGGGEGVHLAWPGGRMRVNGMVVLSGGGLPTATIRLVQPRASEPLQGTATVQPYSAGTAKLWLSPISFAIDPRGTAHFATAITLSGPLGGGFLERGKMRLVGDWRHGRLLVGPGCTAIGFDKIVAPALAVDAARFRLCPRGEALVALEGNRVTVGGRMGATRIKGRLGRSSFSLGASGAELADEGFRLTDLTFRLGRPEAPTRLDLAALEGELSSAGAAGHFSGGAGQIAHVPLILSDAAGSWTLRGGAFALAGGLTVADAAAQPRFHPLAARDVSLRLEHGMIRAEGVLANPQTGIMVSKVSIDHELASGIGHALLSVPGLAFNKDFQPDRLTPLTYGLIANVKGSVSGEARLAWSPAGVTSTGTFATRDADLAAAFGPVTGLSTTMHFTDLLGMVSAPHQVATVAEINPGVAVDDGVLHYQILSSTRLHVEDAHWPFSGGELTLDPSLLDFADGGARRLTFHVKGMDAAQFVQKFDFKNIDASGVFDGVLPMVFTVAGGRIERGSLAVRKGGGTIAYVGPLSQKKLGIWGDMAFEALKSLRYRSLSIALDGPLAGEMVTQVRFAGVKQGEGSRTNFLVRRLMHLPFIFNVTIRAPFRQLIGSAMSLYDPSYLPTDQLSQLIRQERDQAAAGPPGPLDNGSETTHSAPRK